MKEENQNLKANVESWRAKITRERTDKEQEITGLVNNHTGALMRKEEEIKQVTRDHLALQQTHLKFENKHYQLVNDYSTLLANWKDAKYKLETLQNDVELERRRNDIKTTKLTKDLNEALKDNEDLREVITSKSRPQEPIFAEDHYIRGFIDIKNAITEFVAKHSKQHSKPSLSPADQKKILEKLTEFGPYGRYSSEFLTNRLAGLYTNRQFRIPLLRHVFAVFLFDQVFSRFAFSVSQEVSEYLSSIEDHLFLQGYSLSRYLPILDHDNTRLIMIRHAIARGVISKCEDKVSVAKDQAINNFNSLFQKLLPQSRPKDVSDSVQEIMKTALDLKKEMTEERTVYRCFFVCSGMPVVHEQVDVGDDGQVGVKLLLCTFPGLKRLSVDGNSKREEAIVVKADGEWDPTR